MSREGNAGQFLTATAEEGMLIIHSSPITLSWVPRDVVNDAYNVGGTVTVGSFATQEEAKDAARERYVVPTERWEIVDTLPFDMDGKLPAEIHTPEIDGHKVVRHGIRWK